jgi:hypothetical protein
MTDSNKIDIAKTLGLPAKSADYFAALANDAGNWGGAPWLDGNVSGGRGASAMSQTLIKRGLIVVEIGEGGDGQPAAFAMFTQLGVEAAEKIGIDKANFGGNVAPTPDFVPAPAHEISDDAAANRKAARATKSTSKSAASRKSSDKPAKSESESKGVDEIARHIAACFADKKRGTMLKASEIRNMITPAFPSEDVRPPLTTITGRCRVGLLPEGIEGTASPRGARKSK